jgi:transposase
MHACGHKVARRELTVVPAQYKVTEHVETAYSCRHCEQNSDKTPMKTSTAPAPVIKNSGICSPSLLAQILYNKYALALPLYRQEADLKHMGIHVSRQNMANWAVYSSEYYFSLIFKLMQEELPQNDILHGDETSLQVLREDGKLATSKSYMWLYRTGMMAKRPAVLFEYQSSREAEHPRRFLAGFRGYLHTDGYAGYHDIENVTAVGCWTHMRRKFTDVLKTLDDDIRRDSPAQTGLNYCNRLFALEDKYESLTAEDRHERRHELSRPIADSFFAWAKEEFDKCRLPESALGKALTYACNQKPWLMNVFLDGRLELSNNRAENAIRPFTLGRKNWLFSNTPAGAKASAMVYSIVETAKANGLNPYEYLRFLLEQLPQGIAPEDCLPWGEAAQQRCR